LSLSETDSDSNENDAGNNDNEDIVEVKTISPRKEKSLDNDSRLPWLNSPN